MADRQPETPAVFAPQRDRADQLTYQKITFRELDETSSRLARGLERMGIRAGVRTALMVPPSAEFFALTFALFKVGAVPVLIDPGIGLKNFGNCLREAEPQAFVGIAKAQAARVILGWARPFVQKVVTVGRKWFWGGLTLREVEALGQGEGSFPAVEQAAEAMAAILFTSGSTGAPKGAIYTHEMFTAQVEQVRRLYGIQPGEMDLPTFPLFALFGPALGMTEVLPEMDFTRPAQVDPRKIIGAIEQFRITNMFGSPALINRVGRFGAEQGVKLPTLRRVISAGAPVPAKTLARFVAMLGEGTEVFTPYGATECLPVASIGSREILSETRQQTELGRGVCVGRPVPELDLRVIRITDDPIAAWSDDWLVPAGEVGEITVRAAQASRAYFQHPHANALAKIPTADGGFYHRMGDVGYLDEQGRLWFCGRKSHRVVTSGGTLFTIPCEAVFNTHPAVFRTALVGVGGTAAVEPVLCVELEAVAREQPQETLRRELLALGARHPHTQGIRRILFHPAFPVDIRHNAKIFREKLAVWAARQRSL